MTRSWGNAKHVELGLCRQKSTETSERKKKRTRLVFFVFRSYFCPSSFILSTVWTCWQRLRTRQDKKSNQSRNYLLKAVEKDSKAAASQANAKSLVKLTDQKYLWDQGIFARSNYGTIPCSIQESIFFWS